jgi:hypothetical protein
MRFRDPVDCETCRRPVHTPRDYRYRTRSFCSDRCRALDQAKAKKVAREQGRAPRQCASCFDTFEPTRADAIYCCGACRQKEYRQRVTDRV